MRMSLLLGAFASLSHAFGRRGAPPKASAARGRRASSLTDAEVAAAKAKLRSSL